MGARTKIDWADASWNPVTGCLHECEYCYARRIAERFCGFDPDENPDDWKFRRGGTICELDGMQARRQKNGKVVPAFYPFGFTPTFHRYKLDEPELWKKPRNIFVCSMADLFGGWVPDEWIDNVILATQKALQHRYLFLTKAPWRYDDWLERFENGEIKGLDVVENCWFGASASNNEQLEQANRSRAMWLSIEPIRERIFTDEDQFVDTIMTPSGEVERPRWAWVVIGAETGNSKNRIRPEKEWIDDIVSECKRWGTPVFMKESLREIMGLGFIQEFPWEVNDNA